MLAVLVLVLAVVGCGEVIEPGPPILSSDESGAAATRDGVQLPYCDEMNCDLIHGWSWTSDGESHLMVFCQRFDDENCVPNDFGCLTYSQGVECRYRD